MEHHVHEGRNFLVAVCKIKAINDSWIHEQIKSSAMSMPRQDDTSSCDRCNFYKNEFIKAAEYYAIAYDENRRKRNKLKVLSRRAERIDLIKEIDIWDRIKFDMKTMAARAYAKYHPAEKTHVHVSGKYVGVHLFG